MNLKSKNKNMYIVAVISFIIIAVILRKDFMGVISGLKKANLSLLMLATFMMFLYILLEALPFYLLFQSGVQKISFPLIAKITLATQFFNAITPFSTGGQPFQIYIINKKKGIRYGRISSISLQNFIVYQTALVLQGVFALFAHYYLDRASVNFNHRIEILIATGLGINLLIILGLVFISKSERLSHFISINLIEFLAKIKIIKNPLKAEAQVSGFFKDFYRDMNLLSQNKKLFLLAVVINLIKLTIFYALSYVLCMSIGINHIRLISVIVSSSFTMLLSSVFPAPGASGGAELGFLVFFAPIISGSSALVLMLLWRFFTYYLGLILGFLTFVFVFNEEKQIEKA